MDWAWETYWGMNLYLLLNFGLYESFLKKLGRIFGASRNQVHLLATRTCSSTGVFMNVEILWIKSQFIHFLLDILVSNHHQGLNKENQTLLLFCGVISDLSLI